MLNTTRRAIGARRRSIHGQARDHKTNAVRALGAANLDYEFRVFECADAVPSGVEVAAMLGLDPDQVFKTLVTVGKSNEHYVFMIPVAGARPQESGASRRGKGHRHDQIKGAPSLTGYVHGGCSPIGMKKTFVTVVDEKPPSSSTPSISPRERSAARSG